MNLSFWRRPFALAVAVCLALVGATCALAASPSPPPATTGDAAQAAPIPEASATTGPAVELSAPRGNAGLVLTVDYHANGADLKNAVQSALREQYPSSGKSLYDMDTLRIVGDEHLLNIRPISELYEEDAPHVPVLDLSQMANLTKISGSPIYNASFRSVLLPEGLQSIGDNAFADCCSLASLNFPAGLISIGNAAFRGCGLLSADLSGCADLRSLGNYAFFQCKSLVDATLPAELASVGDFAFCGCESLRTLRFPAGLTQLGNWACGNCYSLAAADLSDCAKLDCLPDNLCSNCENLADVHFPAGLTSIGASAFSDCKSLAEVRFPAGLTRIGRHAFSYSGLLSADLSGCVNLRALESYAFFACQSLGDVHFPAGLTSIGNCAFYGCQNLTDAALKPGLTAIGRQAFQECGLTDIAIPASVTDFGLGAFYNCQHLADVTLEPGLRAVGQQAFQNCGLAAVQIPDSVTTLGKSAFSGCSQLKSVTLGAGLTSTGESVFKNCGQLASVCLGGVSSVGASAFQGCTSLPDLVFPAGLAALGENAFTGCKSLHNVYFQGAAAPAGPAADRVFDVKNAAAGESATLLYYPLQNAADYAAWWGDTPENRRIPYDNTGASKTYVNWSKPGQNGAPPAYEVWDTARFELAPFPADESPRVGDYKMGSSVGWALYGPQSGSRAALSGNFPAGGPYTGCVAPSPARPVGVCNLQIEGDLQIYVGEDFGGRRPFPLFDGRADTAVEFLPPPTPAGASWQLTVQNGTGGGYYEADDAAPISAKWQGAPPDSSAKFSHWELVSGAGAFANANSPETRFTMATGDSTVRAVYDTGAVGVQKPLIKPNATTNPPTGDRGGAAGALLLAGAAAVLVRKKVKG